MSDKELNTVMAQNFLSVTVSIHKWSGQVTDNKLANELSDSKGAVSGAAKVVKSLMAGANAEMKAVQAAYDAIRTYVYSATVPHTSGSSSLLKGPRLLPTIRSTDFLKHYGKLLSVAEEARDRFVQVYDQRRQQAISNQGAMSNPMDYPDVTSIPNMFGASISIVPLPMSSDYGRALIPAEVAEALGNRYANQQEAAMQCVMDNMKERIAGEVSRIAEQLGKLGREEKTRVYSSLIGNIRNLNDLLKASNITKDEGVTALTDKIEADLCVHDAEVYKENPTLAADTAKKAQAISDAIDEFDWDLF